MDAGGGQREPRGTFGAARSDRANAVDEELACPERRVDLRAVNAFCRIDERPPGHDDAAAQHGRLARRRLVDRRPSWHARVMDRGRLLELKRVRKPVRAPVQPNHQRSAAPREGARLVTSGGERAGLVVAAIGALPVGRDDQDRKNRRVRTGFAGFGSIR